MESNEQQLTRGRPTFDASEGSAEVLFTPDAVLLRNSQSPDRALNFTLDEWNAFVEGVKLGEFD